MAGTPVSQPQTDFEQIEALFSALVTRSVEEQHDALRAIPDLAIRDRVAALLNAHARFGDDDGDSEPGQTIGVDAMVGPYRLLAKIGVGGMGEVFRAERADGLFTQEVAVKFTRANVSHPDLLRRFAIERQILASLDHPNIVRLLDGGATATGQAYLIMEYLQGVPLTHYAREHKLGLAERLRLFAAVCTAVQHAHQHGIVHRDLKPANILVDAAGIPKVVDFGIAKLLQGPESAQGTMAMWPGPLTPNYASPEQLKGLPVTTACDVYALGVVLYELLSGRRPYNTEGETLDRVVDIVLNQEPRRPSETLASANDAVYPAAQLRGDLDAIVLKAMSKDPASRYASAGELAADVERWLRRDPVLARDRSTLYVLRRLAERHRAVVATAAVALVAVVAALGIAAWQWQTARSAQLRAEQRLRDVRQLANALIFKIQDAVTPLPGSTPVRRTIVDEALKYLEGLESDAADDPTWRLELAQAHRQLGNILGVASVPNLGDREGAIAQYERARALVAPLVAWSTDFDTVAAVVNGNVTLAGLYAGRGERDKARALAGEAVDYATQYHSTHPGDRKAELLVGQALFSVALHAPGEEAYEPWQRALAHYEAMLAATPDDPDIQRNVALVGKYLGGLLENQRRWKEALPIYERSLALDEARWKADPGSRRVQFDVGISYSNLASTAEALGDHDKAAEMFEESIKLRRLVRDADPADAQANDRLGYILRRVAGFYRRTGNLPRAYSLARESTQVLEQLHARNPGRSTAVPFAMALHELVLAESAGGDRRAACVTAARLRRFLADAREKYGESVSDSYERNLYENLPDCTSQAR